MKFKKVIQDKLNSQINFEMYSANLYLSMAAYLDKKSLSGMSNWMKVQAKEEWTHAMKLYEYIVERDGDVELEAVDKPACNYNSVEDVFRASYEHECHVTERFYEMYELSREERDYSTESLLRWFIDEQVEEEATVKDIADRLEFIEGNKHELLQIDRELSTRVFVDSTAAV